jgi:putative zinc finger/helix-turn-helix YgiT family protein
MQCPTCKKDMLRPWKGMITRMRLDFEATGRQCGSCGETILEGDEVQRQEREIATVLVARGVRTTAEFKFVRKMAGFRANEIAELLGVRPETVSRWERGEAEISRSAAFALSELFERPRVSDLENLSPHTGER